MIATVSRHWRWPLLALLLALGACAYLPAGTSAPVWKLPQPETSTPADPAIQQPADLLPFMGGEHTDTPRGIAFTLPDFLQLPASSAEARIMES